MLDRMYPKRHARQLVLIGREIIRMKGTPARLVGHVFAADRA
jgi:hypothetical protein